MIVNNTKQDFIEMKVAECHVWDCDQLLKYDGELQFVHPEWFGQAWQHGLPTVAICTSHIIREGEKVETLPDRPPDFEVKGWDMSGLQEFANKLAENGDGFIGMGNTNTGEWHHVEPELETFDHANQIDKLDAIADTVQKVFPEYPSPEPVQHFSEEELKNLEPKEFRFTHEVIDGDDFLYQEWLMDINEPHKHIGGSL